MQTTLLGIAIALILALLAALVGPLVLDWNQYRPAFEAEASRILGVPVRVRGELDARLLPTPSLRLRNVTLGGKGEALAASVKQLDVEFALGSLMRGEWRATELIMRDATLDVTVNEDGKIGVGGKANAGNPARQDAVKTDPASNLAQLSVDRLAANGRIALHDARSGRSLVLKQFNFSGDVRALAGSLRGDGEIVAGDSTYPYRLSLARASEGLRVRFNLLPGSDGFNADADGVITLVDAMPRFEGALSWSRALALKRDAAGLLETPWRISAKVKADPRMMRFEDVDLRYGADDAALVLNGLGEMRFDDEPRLHAVLSARQLDADRLLSSVVSEPMPPGRLIQHMLSSLGALPRAPFITQLELSADSIMLSGRPVTQIGADLRGDESGWTIARLDLRAPGASRVTLSGDVNAQGGASRFAGGLVLDSDDPAALSNWLWGQGGSSASMGKLSLRADLAFDATQWLADHIKLTFDGSDLRGRVAYRRASPQGETQLDVRAQTANLDADALSPLVQRMVIEPMRSAFAGSMPRILFAFDAGQARLLRHVARDVHAHGAVGGDVMTITQLAVADINHMALDGGGNVDFKTLLGEFNLKAKARNLDDVADVLRALAPDVGRRLSGLGGEKSDADGAFKLTIAPDASQQDHVGLVLNARINAAPLNFDSTVKARVRRAALKPQDASSMTKAWSEALTALDANADLAAVNGPTLLRVLNLDGVLRAGGAPARLTIRLQGDNPRALRSEMKLAGEGLALSLGGALELSASSLGFVSGKTPLKLSLGDGDASPLVGSLPNGARASGQADVFIEAERVRIAALDIHAGGARLSGQLSIGLNNVRAIDGELATQTADLATIASLILGAAPAERARFSSEPFAGAGLGGMTGAVKINIEQARVADGILLTPLSFTLRGDGAALMVEKLRAMWGKGEVSGEARLVSGDGWKMSVRGEARQVAVTDMGRIRMMLPRGRVNVSLLAESAGRSPAALAGSLRGSGTIRLEQAALARFDPAAFDAVAKLAQARGALSLAEVKDTFIRAIDQGDLALPEVDIPFALLAGRMRIDAMPIAAPAARLNLSGAYDIVADQVDARLSIGPQAHGESRSMPDVTLTLRGAADAPVRDFDVAALTSYFAMRAIDRETQRLEALERGRVPDSAAKPTTQAPPVPQAAPAPQTPPTPQAPPTPQTQEGHANAERGPDPVPGALPQPDAVPLPQPRRSPATAARPVTQTPAAQQAPSSPAPSGSAPPLPPPINVHPVPGAASRASAQRPAAAINAAPPLAARPPRPVQVLPEPSLSR